MSLRACPAYTATPFQYAAIGAIVPPPTSLRTLPRIHGNLAQESAQGGPRCRRRGAYLCRRLQSHWLRTSARRDLVSAPRASPRVVRDQRRHRLAQVAFGETNLRQLAPLSEILLAVLHGDVVFNRR